MGAIEQDAAGISDLAVLPLADLLQFLHSTETGLSAPDAAATLKTVGPNRIESARPKSLLTAFIERLLQLGEFAQKVLPRVSGMKGFS